MTAAKKSIWNLPILNSRTNKQKVTLPEMIFGYFLGLVIHGDTLVLSELTGYIKCGSFNYRSGI